MSRRELRAIEDNLYRTSDAHFFRTPATLSPDGENLDIPTYMREGIELVNGTVQQEEVQA